MLILFLFIRDCLWFLRWSEPLQEASKVIRNSGSQRTNQVYVERPASTHSPEQFSLFKSTSNIISEQEISICIIPLFWSWLDSILTEIRVSSIHLLWIFQQDISKVYHTLLLNSTWQLLSLLSSISKFETSNFTTRLSEIPQYFTLFSLGDGSVEPACNSSLPIIEIVSQASTFTTDSPYKIFWPYTALWISYFLSSGSSRSISSSHSFEVPPKSLLVDQQPGCLAKQFLPLTFAIN